MLLEKIEVNIPPDTYIDPQILFDAWYKFTKRNLVINDFIEEYVHVKYIPARNRSITTKEEAFNREQHYYISVRKWYIYVQGEYNRQVDIHNKIFIEMKHSGEVDITRMKALHKLKSNSGLILSEEEVEACLFKSPSNKSLVSLTDTDTPSRH